MVEPVRFFLDEHISESVALALRSHGIDVLTVSDVGRKGLPDVDQLRFAASVGRVVVSHDTDFLVLDSEFQITGEHHAGIAFGKARKYAGQVGKFIHVLLTLHGVYNADDMRNHLEYL